VFETVTVPVAAWETLNPLQDSNRKRKKWRREHNALSYTQTINVAWITQVEAENAYRAAQKEVAQIPAPGGISEPASRAVRKKTGPVTEGVQQ
jgi:hypothetical protein